MAPRFTVRSLPKTICWPAKPIVAKQLINFRKFLKPTNWQYLSEYLSRNLGPLLDPIMLKKFPIFNSPRGIIVLSMLGVAIISAISLSFIKDLCGGCASSAKMAPIPGLNIVGAIYYGLTMAGLVWFGLRKWTVAPLFFAAGVHSVLLYWLFKNEAFCANCFTCAVCVFLAAVTARKGQTARFAGLSVVAGLATCLITFSSLQTIFLTLERQDAERLIGFAMWPKQTRGPLKVTIFAKDTCDRCKEFKRTQFVRMKETFGKQLEFEIRTPPGKIRLPSIVIGGEQPKLFVGKPTWKDLSAAINVGLSEVTDDTSLSAKESISTR